MCIYRYPCLVQHDVEELPARLDGDLLQELPEGGRRGGGRGVEDGPVWLHAEAPLRVQGVGRGGWLTCWGCI